MKKIIKIATICFTIFVLLFGAFFITHLIIEKHDSYKIYLEQKRKLSVLDMVRYYTGFKFSNKTQVVKSKYQAEDEDKRTEYLHVILNVSQKEIDKLFPQKSRDYNLSHVSQVEIVENHLKDISFSAKEFQSVERNWDATQRSMHFYIMKPHKGYAKVFVSIDMLGWSL